MAAVILGGPVASTFRNPPAMPGLDLRSGLSR